VRYDEGDILTVLDEELELVGETLSRAETLPGNTLEPYEQGGTGGSGVGAVRRRA
jgi:hypothetical protein